MKPTGYVRKVDALGRIVLPKKIMKELGLKYNDQIEVELDGEMLAVKKYFAKCDICRRVGKLIEIKERLICENCMAELKLKK